MAVLIYALELYLLKVLLLKFIDCLQRVNIALARSSIVLSRLRSFPSLNARSAEVRFTMGTLFSLHDDIVAKVT